jgi:hypothetical protein
MFVNNLNIKNGIEEMKKFMVNYEDTELIKKAKERVKKINKIKIYS